MVLLAVQLALTASRGPTAIAGQAGYERAELIYALQARPTSQCHASTLAESRRGLVVAWFGGLREKDPGVGIWLSRREGSAWTVPVEVANGIESEQRRYPCWNPVLFQPRAGPLLLFYRVGPSPRRWWSMLMTSADGGRSWSVPRRLPDGVLGPIKNKPVELDDGRIVCPTSSEAPGWRVHFDITADLGATWTRGEPVRDPHRLAAIQPAILRHTVDRLQALCRTQRKCVAETWSSDGGRTWSDLAPTSLPNPNSGLDAVILSDGRQLLVYNHTRFGRSPLNVALSIDGRRWTNTLVLEDEEGEFSYPAVIQTSDGRVHITYTYQRQAIKHVVLDPAQLVAPR